MKLLICSDIHGDLTSAEKIVTAFKNEGAEKLIILGDILYHGPRNDLPKGYNPKGVIPLLNSVSDSIISVRGNCDAEVDDMVLDFSVLADYAYLSVDSLRIFITHGHRYNTDNPPSLSKGDVLLHGHTHVPAFVEFGDENLYINPGSVSIPKESSKPSYIVYENRKFTFKDIDGEVISEHTV